MLARSVYRTAGGEEYARWWGAPRSSVPTGSGAARGQLRPVSFSLSLARSSARNPTRRRSDGSPPGEDSVGMQVSCGAPGGVAYVEGAFEREDKECRSRWRKWPARCASRWANCRSGARVRAESAGVRPGRRGGRARRALHARLAATNVWIERVREYAPSEFSVRIPARTEGRRVQSGSATVDRAEPALQLLPPKVTHGRSSRRGIHRANWSGSAGRRRRAVV